MNNTMNNLQKNKQEDCCGDVDKNRLAAKINST